jgi:hypothetical protein
MAEPLLKPDYSKHDKVPEYRRLEWHGSTLLRFIRKVVGPVPFSVYRHLRNTIITPFLRKPSLTTAEYKGGVRFWDEVSYTKALQYYLAKHQTFEEYQADRGNEPKTYLDLDFSVYYQTYKNRQATYASLQSLRKNFPHVPVLLISDGGDDFSAIARHFNCEYRHDSTNIGYWPCKDLGRWFDRLAQTCTLFNTEWVLTLEDDVRTRDRISKYPHAHLAGQGGSRGTKITKELHPAAQAYIKDLHPDITRFGISGCGGAIFHRESFMDCVSKMRPGDIETWTALEPGFGANDIALTFLFLVNGYVARRWLDLSHDSVGNWGPASAFDHQFKKYYHESLPEEDERILASLI